MRKILVIGGTVFVSRFVADYFAQKGDDVYVLNRNSKPQLPNVTLIEGDRNDLGNKLRDMNLMLCWTLPPTHGNTWKIW